MTFRNLSLVLILGVGIARADVTPTPPPGSGPLSAAANSTAVQLDPVVVTGQLDQARQQILPNLGATAYTITGQNIQDLSQGDDAPFNQVLLRAPGVAEDSAPNGDLHVRGEHANLQYRINDVLLPEGISGFGLELSSQFVDSLQLITGSLPAQYGFRTAGIVAIKTKSGVLDPGGELSVYGGSYDTIRPSVEAGGSSGNASAYVDASYDQNDLGIENPTPSATPIHDRTDQKKAFVYVSDILDSTSRISLIGSASYSNYQVPDTPGLPAGTSPDGSQWLPGYFDSAKLNETQNEQNYYGVIAYQKSAGDLNYQVSAFARESIVNFMPDPVGDLYFNGVASNVDRRLESVGLQTDASYAMGGQHTLRGGVFVLSETVQANSATTVFPVDADGDPTGPAFPIVDNHQIYGLFVGAYLQDEWNITPQLTLNYGARFDVYNASFDNENQLSPRINLVWQPSATTALHAGYSRYFTPPPIENVSGATLAKFIGTSNQASVEEDDPVKAERSNYFDVGVGQTIVPGLQVGLDGYFKRAKNQLDDGLFGQSLILSAFNYAQGEVYGAELTGSYNRGGFSAYGNLARSQAEGKDWNSAQFLFDPADLAYVQNHWIHLDHDQRLSGSFGTAYQWTERQGSTRLYLDTIYGTGLRDDITAPDGANIPNGGSVPSYVTVNLGAEQTVRFDSHHSIKFRLEGVNLADRIYELRDGTGVGVNAAQYGERRGFFGSVSSTF
jgi:outer membrane receptor protein involved in Fe transport